MTIQWPAESIWQQVAPSLPNFTVEILPEIDSTNTELVRRARAGQTDPILLVAERQTAGRGRLGRQWQSDLSGGQTTLCFSVGMPLAPPDWSGLSLAVGVAVAQSLHADIRLKWPNDLWYQNRKLAGILIETAAMPGVAGGSASSRYAVVGVGINIQPPAAPGLNTPPAGLCELLAGIHPPAALQLVAAPLVAAILQFEREGFAAFQTHFSALDALRGHAIAASDGSQGTAKGVDNSGALLVHTPQGVQRIISSEVSVRPAPVARGA